MLAKQFVSGAIFASCCLLGATTTGSLPANPGPEAARLTLKDLEISFHEAFTCADYDMMLSLWAEDGVFSSPAGTFVGPTEIADFMSSSPLWGKASSLSSNYKALSSVYGKTAELAFECIIVDVSGLNPLTTALSSIPFGSQNPDVEIVQHSNATCRAVRIGDKWVFKTFKGAAGPILP